MPNGKPVDLLLAHLHPALAVSGTASLLACPQTQVLRGCRGEMPPPLAADCRRSPFPSRLSPGLLALGRVVRCAALGGESSPGALGESSPDALGESSPGALVATVRSSTGGSLNCLPGTTTPAGLLAFPTDVGVPHRFSCPSLWLPLLGLGLCGLLSDSDRCRRSSPHASCSCARSCATCCWWEARCWVICAVCAFCSFVSCPRCVACRPAVGNCESAALAGLEP